MAQTARAVVCREMNKPVVVEHITVDSPKRGEVLIKLAACGVCHSDLSATNGTIPLQLPLILGHDVAGTVVQVAPRVRQLKLGDEVYARPDHFQIGSLAEFIAVKESSAATKAKTKIAPKDSPR